MTIEHSKYIEELKQQVTPARIQSVVNEPINKSWIKERKQGNNKLSYVSGSTVIRLLNKAFGFGWSFRIIEHKIIEAEKKADMEYVNNRRVQKKDQNGNLLFIEQPPVAHVLGQLSVPGYGVKEQFGSQPLLGGSSEQESAFKSASTDAMKKCASMFGIALELYGDDNDFRYIREKDEFVNEFHIPKEEVKVIHVPKEEVKKEVKEQIKEEVKKEVKEIEVESEEEQTVKRPTVKKEEVSIPSNKFPSKEEIKKNKEKMEQKMDELYESEENREPVINSKQEDSKEVISENKPKTWNSKEVKALVANKKALGIKNNDELSPYLVDFFNDKKASYHMINPDNMEQINEFLKDVIAKKIKEKTDFTEYVE